MINERIKNIDKQIQQIIEQDAQVSRKVDQITSARVGMGLLSH